MKISLYFQVKKKPKKQTRTIKKNPAIPPHPAPPKMYEEAPPPKKKIKKGFFLSKHYWIQVYDSGDKKKIVYIFSN